MSIIQKSNQIKSNQIKSNQLERTEKDINEVHIISAGFKALNTELCQNGITLCREACGGHGYSALNRLGELRDDQDIAKTFEGYVWCYQSS